MAYIASKDGKNGKRYYVVYAGPNGQKQWEAAGRRRKDAEAYLRRIRSELAAGTLGKNQSISFADFSTKWLEDYAQIRVKVRTLVDYQQVIKNHLMPFFGKTYLENITPAQVQNYIAHKSRSGLSPRTVNKTVTLLKTMFKHAIRWGYLTDDPARFAEKPREAKKEMEYLTPDEVRRFLEAANPEFYPLFATAVLTGARQGEILALRRSDVDLKRRVMFIHRSYHPQYGFSEPKTKSGTRAIVISGELTMILDEYMEKNDRQPGDLVFQNKGGNPVDPQNMMTREFHPALERAGVKPIRFHDLRHTYAALIIALGENIKFIQRQLGHASLTTTMDTYGHLLPEVSEGFGDRLDSLLFQNNVVYFLKKRPEGTKKRPIAGSNG